MTTPIRRALVPDSHLQARVEDGIQAIETAHRDMIEMEVRTVFADSLEIDKAFEKGHENENRWDYLLGIQTNGKIVGLEPHTANNHEVSVVISKRAAALQHLRGHLKPGVHVADWLWVASGRVDFVPMDKQITRLAQNGIKFVGKKVLRKALPGD